MTAEKKKQRTTPEQIFGWEESKRAARRIEAFIERTDIKQRDIAERTNGVVPQGRISDLLLGKHRFTSHTLGAIAKVMGATIAELVAPESTPEPRPPTQQSEITQEVNSGSDPDASISPLLRDYFSKRHLLEDEKRLLRGLGTLLYRDQPLSFQVLDDIVASIRRNNPHPASS